MGFFNCAYFLEGPTTFKIWAFTKPTKGAWFWAFSSILTSSLSHTHLSHTSSFFFLYNLFGKGHQYSTMVVVIETQGLLYSTYFQGRPILLGNQVFFKIEAKGQEIQYLFGFSLLESFVFPFYHSPPPPFSSTIWWLNLLECQSFNPGHF